MWFTFPPAGQRRTDLFIESIKHIIFLKRDNESAKFLFRLGLAFFKKQGIKSARGKDPMEKNGELQESHAELCTEDCTALAGADELGSLHWQYPLK